MTRSGPAESAPEPAGATTLLRSISEGVKTIVTVTERLTELRTEAAALRGDLYRLAELVYRMAGRLDGVEQRFNEVDKRTDLAVKLAVREELDRHSDFQAKSAVG
jgi:hypothetical protein